MVVSTARRRKAYLRLDGRSPIPLAFRVNAWLRSDGSLIVEGKASPEEDLALMIGARGRINTNDGSTGIGVRIAATDHERGIVRFLVQPWTLS